MFKIFYKKNKNKFTNRGFALFYSLVIIGVVLIATSMFLETALEEFFISSDRKESDMALYMAESGINCARYHQDNGYWAAFKTAVTEPKTFNCGEGVTFSAGWNTLENQNNYLPSSNDDCFYADDEDLIFGLGLNSSDYSLPETLVDTKPAFVIESTGDNDACARVTVEIKSKSVDYGFGSFGACKIIIRSVGASECDSNGFPKPGSVERTLIHQTQ
jgi:hypothetical protein